MNPPDEMRPAAADTAGTRENTGDARKSSATSAPAQPRKWRRILQALVDGRTLNRFEAARELRDHVLPSTVSELEKRGLTIHRKGETVPGAFGPAHCCRYWLAPESRARALELLGDAP